jgi:chitin disaccharide deacetylase
MKHLIVNGDDFGASHGVNRGILEAHARGILTSASLMVSMPASEQAAELARARPSLSLGLHADLDGIAGLEEAGTELRRQVERFCTLVGRPPTHLDSHHNVHRGARVLPLFLELARCLDVPLREHGPIRSVSRFYGQWAGETHAEQIGVPSLIRILETDLHSGVTELCCHPGYVEADFPSSYRAERQIELQTLCSPAVRQAVEHCAIRLISFHEVTADYRVAP